jgi:uncharacterized protein (DUF58 family)
VLHLVREVLFFQPKRNRTNVANALEYLLRVSKRRGIVFVVSDFLSPDFTRPLAMAAKKHDVVAVWLTDPREEQLEMSGMVRVWDQEARIERVIDLGSRAARERFRSYAQRRNEETTAIFRRHGIDSVRIETGQDYIVPLSMFFKARANRR